MKKQNQENATWNTLNHIKGLYDSMLAAAPCDEDYRCKIAKELFHLQREDGAWRVIEDLRAPMDIRVAYIYEPTYYATAAIMTFMNANGEMNKEEKESLTKGLKVAAERQLNGSGFEATRGRLEALAIYKAAGLYEWMNRFGEQYPDFSDMIRKVINDFQIALMTGRTFSDWEVDFKEEFSKEVVDYEEAMIPWVWYAAYGSNISRERFMRYINGCADCSAPLEDRSYEFPYDITFAGRASSWGNQGKAFLDDSKNGMALGRIYKISRAQFEEIQRKEGRDYTKRICLGVEEGIPVYTFTTDQLPAVNNSPSADYLEVILKGLIETYPKKSELALRVYLFSHNVMSSDDRNILNYIRCSEHGVSLQQIADAPECPCLTKTRSSVKKLASWGLIKQDTRSLRTGDRMQDRAAVFYTRKESRDLIDILLLTVR